MDFNELISGSRWVWVTIAVIAAIAITVRVMGW
jgi:hypothetical protein